MQMATRAGQAVPKHLNGSGHPPANFDLEKSKLSMSPRMFWGIVAGSVAGAVFIAALLVNTNWRIGGVEQGIADLKAEIQTDRENTQTKQQAYIDCLEAERSNKGFNCPMAKTARTTEPEKAPVRRKAVVTKKTETSGWSLFGPAVAGGDKK